MSKASWAFVPTAAFLFVALLTLPDLFTGLLKTREVLIDQRVHSLLCRCSLGSSHPPPPRTSAEKIGNFRSLFTQCWKPSHISRRYSFWLTVQFVLISKLNHHEGLNGLFNQNVHYFKKGLEGIFARKYCLKVS